MLRGAGFLVLWLALSGSAAPADVAAGLAASALGAWASLRLAPPEGGPRFRPLAMAHLFLRLPAQVLVAGIDVARRALAPRMRIAPGLVPFTPHAAGRRADLFLALSSLLPGTLPAAPGTIHALDTTRPVAAELAAEEARFARATGHR